MRKKRLFAVVIVLAAAGLVCAAVLLTRPAPTFGDPEKYGLLSQVPVPVTEAGSIGRPFSYGKDAVTVRVKKASQADFEAYEKLLERNGFHKYCENDLNGDVLSASFCKAEVSVTVDWLPKCAQLDIRADALALSPHLQAPKTASDGEVSLHLLQLNDNGSSFVIRLANGHFLVEDGGRDIDAPYLLDYLESMTPEGELPVVEGWFITHAHSDHSGALKAIVTDGKMRKRLAVDGLYYVEPGEEFMKLSSEQPADVWFMSKAAAALKNEAGESAALYRPALGQRYYFDGVSIDIAFTLEQHTSATFTGDFNNTSTWYLHHFGDQTFLHAGDAATNSIYAALQYLEPTFFDFDVFASLHHGINTYDFLTDLCSIRTLLYTSFREGSIYEEVSKHARLAENARLRASCEEVYCHGGGTVVLTFPYETGSAQILPSWDWKYNFGSPQRHLWGINAGAIA